MNKEEKKAIEYFTRRIKNVKTQYTSIYFKVKHFKTLLNLIEKQDNIINTAIDYKADNTHIEHDGDEYGYMEWMEVDIDLYEFITTLTEILEGKKVEQDESKK